MSTLKATATTWDPEQGPDSVLPAIPDWLTPLLVPFVERTPYERVKADPNTFGIIDLAEEMGLHPRPSGNGRHSIQCIFHDGDNEASLVLYPDDNHFHCFGCNAHGDMFDLHRRRSMTHA